MIRFEYDVLVGGVLCWYGWFVYAIYCIHAAYLERIASCAFINGAGGRNQQ